MPKLYILGGANVQVILRGSPKSLVNSFFMGYDFSTLDSNDFELLARDILNAKFGMDLQSFKAGKDKGIIYPNQF